MTCGHIETRKMREATAGVPWSEDVVLTAGCGCDYCEPSKPGFKQRSAPVRNLECCCCGETTRGRQWWNRDTGYGMCLKCIAYVRSHGDTDEQIHDCYGVEGVHWNIDENPEMREELGKALA
jgi:hypothetical protein